MMECPAAFALFIHQGERYNEVVTGILRYTERICCTLSFLSQT